MSDFDLNAFLAEQRSEGTSEGGGEFTISHEKAAQKMSQYSLPREHAWALKLVQCAVSWRCSNIKLTQTRNHSTFTFYTEDAGELPSNEQIVSAILRADHESQDPTATLGAALRIVVEKAHLSFLLRVDREQGDAQAIYAGVYFSEMGEQNRAKQRAHWEGNLNLRIHHIPHTDPNRLLLNYIPVRAHALPILWELEEYAYLSPVPILVDGRRIDGVLHGTARPWSSSRRPIRVGGFDIPDPTSPPLELCSGFADQTLSFHARLKDTGQEGQLPNQAYLVMSIDCRQPHLNQRSRPQNSSLYWVRDGIVVDQEKLSFLTRCLDVEVFGAAHGLSSDLTGFQLRRDHAFLERRTEILTQVDRFLEWELDDRRDIFAKDKGKDDDQPDQDNARAEASTVASTPEIAPFPKPPRGVFEAVGILAKGVSALTRSLLKELQAGPSWEEPLVREDYLQDLDDIIHRESKKAPIPNEIDAPATSEDNAAKPVSGNLGSKYSFQGNTPTYVYEVQEKTTFQWLPPEER